MTTLAIRRNTALLSGSLATNSATLQLAAAVASLTLVRVLHVEGLQYAPPRSPRAGSDRARRQRATQPSRLAMIVASDDASTDPPAAIDAAAAPDRQFKAPEPLMPALAEWETDGGRVCTYPSAVPAGGGLHPSSREASW